MSASVIAFIVKLSAIADLNIPTTRQRMYYGWLLHYNGVYNVLQTHK